MEFSCLASLCQVSCVSADLPTPDPRSETDEEDGAFRTLSFPLKRDDDDGAGIASLSDKAQGPDPELLVTLLMDPLPLRREARFTSVTCAEPWEDAAAEQFAETPPHCDCSPTGVRM